MGPKNPRTTKKRFLPPKIKNFSNFKNTSSQKPEFSQEGSFQYKTQKIEKKFLLF
jgi:hypothetical protein